MNPINKKKVKLKNLIGIISEPTYEDLLFEIAYFLDNLKRYDGEFKLREVSLFTRVRINENVIDDLEKLVEMGYISKLKYSSFKLLKHNWE